jgi:hypothetical protein
MWLPSDDDRIPNVPGIKFYAVFIDTLSDGGEGTGIIGKEKVPVSSL